MNENTLDDAGRNILGFLVRLLGFFLLLAGLWVALQVLLTAKNLYEHPENIERFAVAIEKGSNIDKTLAPLRDSLILESDSENGVQRYSETEKKTFCYRNRKYSSFLFLCLGDCPVIVAIDCQDFTDGN